MFIPKRKVVVGIGEIIAGDYGLGKHALRLVQREFRSQNDIDFIEAGTAGFDLAQIIEQSSHLLVLDAVDMGRMPGTIIEFERSDIEFFEGLRLLAHQIEFHTILTAASKQGKLPEHLYFIGMQPNFFTPGFDLSKEVTMAMPDMLRRAAFVLKKWQSVQETEFA